MSARILAVAVDCHRPDELAAFWREALGYPDVESWDDSQGVRYVELKAPNLPSLLFQPVPEAKPGKNRLHLDIAPLAGSQRAEIDRLVALGATVIDEAARHPWVVMADPEGNEFCVLPPR